MSKARGMGALFLIGVFAFLFIVANIMMYFFISVFAGETQNLFFISMETNERGKELKSLLSAEQDGYYIEILGDLAAEGGDAGFEDSEGRFVSALQEMEKKCLVVFRSSYTKDPVGIIGTCPEETGQDLQVADIPIPGARVSETKMRVMIG